MKSTYFLSLICCVEKVFGECLPIGLFSDLLEPGRGALPPPCGPHFSAERGLGVREKRALIVRNRGTALALAPYMGCQS